MFSRNTLTSGNIGSYSELLVAAAYLSEGYEVALPLASQTRWDMVVRDPAGRWSSVQVKTIPQTPANSPAVMTSTTLRNMQVPYSSKDVDVIVAVHPETGTIWRVPPEIFEGKSRVQLRDEYLWRGKMERLTTPVSSTGLPYVINPRRRTDGSLEGMLLRKAQRKAMANGLPAVRPEWLRPDTLEMIKMWVDGFGFKTIARNYNMTAAGVRCRVFLALNRLGLKELPRSVETRHWTASRRGGRAPAEKQAIAAPASEAQASLW